MKPIAIVDYGAGNLRSVQKAFEHLGYEAAITSDPEAVAAAPAIVFPGQGASPPAMASLGERDMANVLREAIAAGKPFFGVCLGLQLLLEWSEEGGTTCLGVVPGNVRRFGAGLKVPHMGWNAVRPVRPHLLFHDVPDDSHFYFVHSYFAAPSDDAWVLAETDYGGSFASVLARGNLVATQFHPEKSGAVGLRLYDNFMRRIVGLAATGSRPPDRGPGQASPG